MNYTQYRNLLWSSPLNGTGTPVSHKHAENLAVDYTWAFATSPAPVTAVTGTVADYTVTFPATAGATEGDFLLFSDASGQNWIVALDVDGTGIANAGALFTSVPAVRRAVVDISALVGADAVAAACVAALNLLGGFVAAFSLTDNADGTVEFIPTVRGPLATFASYIAAETAVGSITFAPTVAGVDSAFMLTSEIVHKVGHGLTTGQSVKLTIGAGAIPAPFVAGTTYFVIRVGVNDFQLAASLADAVAGTPIGINDQGTAGETVTFTVQANVGTLYMEYTTDLLPTSSSVWVAIDTINLVTASSPVQTRIPVNYYNQIRCRLAVTSGNLTSITAVSFGKEQG